MLDTPYTVDTRCTERVVRCPEVKLRKYTPECQIRKCSGKNIPKKAMVGHRLDKMITEGLNFDLQLDIICTFSIGSIMLYFHAYLKIGPKLSENYHPKTKS